MSFSANETSGPSVDRAIRKLGPGDWKVTNRSLQQATAWQVGQLKASWFGASLVYDLCCGIGGDAIPLARRGDVAAVDSDDELCKMLQENFSRLNGSHEFQVQCADVTTIKIPPGSAIHIDPDRRSPSRRTIRPADYRPAWQDVCRIISSAEAGVVKLAPAAKLDSGEMGDSHRCWISLSGSVREQSLLYGATIDRAGLRPNGRSAVSMKADGTQSWYRPKVSLETPSVEISNQPMSLLIDPDAAVRAAGLTESFAHDFGMRFLDRASGFLTANKITQPAEQIAVVGEVIWYGACDDRKLRREFRERDVFPQTIKVRGTDHDPAVLTKRYRKYGQTPVTLWIGRTRKRVFAAITK